MAMKRIEVEVTVRVYDDLMGKTKLVETSIQRSDTAPNSKRGTVSGLIEELAVNATSVAMAGVDGMWSELYPAVKPL